MRLLLIGPSLEPFRIRLVDLDDAGKRLDAEVGERHDAFVTWTIDPDQTILLVHFLGDILQPVLVFTEHLGDTGDGADVVDLVDRQDQAATAAVADTLGTQFHGSSSSSRCAGCVAIRARTSASQA